MTSLTFYGGANEIGGNKFLLEDKGAKIYLDFGESFNFGEDYFYEYLAPRTANGMEVLFEFDLIPKVGKLYNKEMLKFTDLKYEKPDVDAIFISHSHSDHVGHLPYVDEDIPIYMGHGTRRIIEIYHKLFPGLYDIGEHNNIMEFKSGDQIKIKHLVIEPVHVEHSVPAAYGFIIHTSKGPIVYTGDLRMHGPRSDMTNDFVMRANEVKPNILLCEGTRMSHEIEHNYSEKEVEGIVLQIVSESQGLVLAYFSMLNIDRIMTFYNAAIANKRKLVVDTRLAYIIHNLRDKISVLPDVMNDPNVLVYFRLCKSCTFDKMDYYPWERDFMSKMVTYKEINAHQNKFLMHLGFYRLMELVYLQPNNADFIYSSSEHFYEGEDNEEQRTIWENWMKHFKIKFHKAHCSGHASKQDIIEFVKKINSKVLIPIHTENPEEFKKIHTNIKIPVKGEEIRI